MAADVPGASSSGGYPGSEHDAEWRRLVLPADYRQPVPRERYHLVVIGGGPAGLAAATRAASLGASVALAERHAMGGDYVSVCVPSKALLELSRDSSLAFDDAFERLRRVRAAIAARASVERLAAAGIDVFHGSAKFVDDDLVQVGSARLATRRTVIATGSHPVLPPIRGLAESRPLTHETLFELKRPPKRLAILGAASIGCEIAQAFARLGVEVVLIERAERVLPDEDPRASETIAAALRDAGVSILLGVDVSGVERRGASITLDVDTAGERLHVVADELFVSAGRQPTTDELNLAAVGVELDAAGRIVVDRYLRTTNPRIYAAGDVCSAVELAHNADAHARIVVRNALFAPTATTERLVIPRCTYTDPEVAQIGPLAGELERSRVAFDRYTSSLDELDRGRLQGSSGFVEILTDAGTDRIIGATIVARGASELVAPIAIAMTRRLGLSAIGDAVLPYPTLSEFLRYTAERYRRTRLSPVAKRLIGAWLRWRT